MKQGTVANLMLGVSWVLIGYAVIWGMAPYISVNAPAHILLDILAWPMSDGTPVWDGQLMWMSSIGSGLLMALGIIFLGVVYPAVKQGDMRVIKVTITAMLAWFVVDSAGSIASGFTANAVFNALTLVPILAPLLLALRMRR